MKNIIICDIDGTLCTDEHRNHLLNYDCENCQGIGRTYLGGMLSKPCKPCQGSGKLRKWDEYFDLCHLDPPVEAVIRCVGAMYAQGCEIHLMTARVDTVRMKTLDWLANHGVPYHSITFRPADCRVQDNVLKTKWADELGGPERVLFVLEDRQRVVDAWRSAGYTCFQVAPGNF